MPQLKLVLRPWLILITLAFPFAASAQPPGFDPNAGQETWVTLKITDTDGNVLNEAEANLLLKGSYWTRHAMWVASTEGVWKFQKESATPYQFQREEDKTHTAEIVVRARGYAPAFLPLETPVKKNEYHVKLEKGRRMELTLHTSWNGKSLPDEFLPTTFFLRHGPFAWNGILPSDTVMNDAIRKSQFNLSPMEKLSKNTFAFHTTEDASDLLIYINEPGFLRGYIAGPFSKDDLADGKIDVNVPKGGTLKVSVSLPSSVREDEKFDVTSVHVWRTLKFGGANQQGIGFSHGDLPKGTYSMTQQDVPPGEYQVGGHYRMKRNSQETYGSDYHSLTHASVKVGSFWGSHAKLKEHTPASRGGGRPAPRRATNWSLILMIAGGGFIVSGLVAMFMIKSRA